MNAHRQIIEPQKRPKKKTNLAKFRGILKDLPQEEKEKMDNFFKDIRNEWEQSIIGLEQQESGSLLQ